ncbi:MAG: glycoside hydrolase family 5 protein [Crocosphaera sp.]|nr:glycoside hydrolase family 5 protein [Crocosphaera sp.]
MTLLIISIINSFSFSQNYTKINFPLSTSGTKIIDAKNKEILLRGVNWFGMETELHVPHGLWVRDYQDILMQIKSLGYNVIRIPFSLKALQSSDINGIDFSLKNNKILRNKTPLQVLDILVKEAEKQGLMIILDCHRNNDQRIPELWYGDGFSEKDWLETWTMLAHRYQQQKNIIGADLKNEPHGKASWGNNNLLTDWRLAAERCGNAILKINPHWLIIVEGVENNVPGQQLKHHWQGGNLEGVKQHPIRLSNQHKLVYSIHEYGPGVYTQTWFNSSDFPENLLKRWEIGFGYILTQKIAPVFIGEFGGRKVDQQSTEGIWQRKFIEYIKHKKLSFTYWCLNPNSDDTGGLLLEDWITIESQKQNLLSSLLQHLN